MRTQERGGIIFIYEQINAGKNAINSSWAIRPSDGVDGDEYGDYDSLVEGKRCMVASK